MWLQRINNNELEEANMAAQGFLHLLGELRIAFLQDSVLLRRRHPSHPIWQHAVFRHPAYAPFEQAVLDAVKETAIEPAEVVLRKTVPLVAERINTLSANVRTVLTEGHRELSSQIKELDNKLTDIFPLTITVSSKQDLQRTSNPDPIASSTNAKTAIKNSSTATSIDSASSSVYATPRTSSPDLPTADTSSADSTVVTGDSTNVLVTGNDCDDSILHTFRMS
jgi:hypothetical protein